MHEKLMHISLNDWVEKNGDGLESARKLHDAIVGNSKLTIVKISDCSLESIPCFALIHGAIANILSGVSSIALLCLDKLRYGDDEVMDPPWGKEEFRTGEEILKSLTCMIAALAKRLQVPRDSSLVPRIKRIDLKEQNRELGRHLQDRSVALDGIRIGASGVFFLDQQYAGTRVTIKQSTGTTATHVRAQTSMMTLMGFHPNIVSPMGFFENYLGESHVVWEAMDGDLSDFLQSKPPPSHSDRLEFALQLATALEYLHRFGIYHLALGPGNILYKREAEKIIVKVADFGEFATLTKRPITRRRGFLPPEIRALPIAREHLTKWTREVDIWAFGIVLYLLMNQHQGKANMPEELRVYQFHDFPSNSIWNCLGVDPHLPVQLDFPGGDIVRQCLTWPSNRVPMAKIVSMLKAETQ